MDTQPPLDLSQAIPFDQLPSAEPATLVGALPFDQLPNQSVLPPDAAFAAWKEGADGLSPELRPGLESYFSTLTIDSAKAIEDSTPDAQKRRLPPTALRKLYEGKRRSDIDWGQMAESAWNTAWDLGSSAIKGSLSGGLQNLKAGASLVVPGMNAKEEFGKVSSNALSTLEGFYSEGMGDPADMTAKMVNGGTALTDAIFYDEEEGFDHWVARLDTGAAASNLIAKRGGENTSRIASDYGFDWVPGVEKSGPLGDTQQKESIDPNLKNLGSVTAMADPVELGGHLVTSGISKIAGKAAKTASAALKKLPSIPVPGRLAARLENEGAVEIFGTTISDLGKKGREGIASLQESIHELGQKAAGADVRDIGGVSSSLRAGASIPLRVLEGTGDALAAVGRANPFGVSRTPFFARVTGNAANPKWVQKVAGSAVGQGLDLTARAASPFVKNTLQSGVGGFALFGAFSENEQELGAAFGSGAAAGFFGTASNVVTGPAKRFAADKFNGLGFGARWDAAVGPKSRFAGQMTVEADPSPYAVQQAGRMRGDADFIFESMSPDQKAEWTKNSSPEFYAERLEYLATNTKDEKRAATYREAAKSYRDISPEGREVLRVQTLLEAGDARQTAGVSLDLNNSPVDLDLFIYSDSDVLEKAATEASKDGTLTPEERANLQAMQERLLTPAKVSELRGKAQGSEDAFQRLFQAAIAPLTRARGFAEMDKSSVNGRRVLKIGLNVDSLLRRGTPLWAAFAHEKQHALTKLGLTDVHGKAMKKKLFGERSEVDGKTIYLEEGEISQDAQKGLFLDYLKEFSAEDRVHVLQGMLAPAKRAEFNQKFVDTATGEPLLRDSEVSLQLFDYLDETEWRPYLEDEVLADISTAAWGDQKTPFGGSAGGYVSSKFDTTRKILDWAILTQASRNAGRIKKGLARAVNAFGGKFTEDYQSSLFRGLRFSPAIRSLYRQFTAAADAYQTQLRSSKLREAPGVSVEEAVLDPALVEHFKDAPDLFETRFKYVIEDENGPLQTVTLTRERAEELGVLPKAKFTKEKTAAGKVRYVPGEGREFAKPKVDVAKLLAEAEKQNGSPARPPSKAKVTGITEELVKDANGKPTILSKVELRRRLMARPRLMAEALATAPQDGTGHRMFEASPGNWRGVPSVSQVEAVLALDDVILPVRVKEAFATSWNLTSDGHGGRVLMEYQAALKNGRYASLSPKLRDEAVIGFQLSKEGNLLLTSISVSRIFDKLHQWREAGRLQAWGNDVNAAYRDLQAYTQNHNNGRPGATGLDADSQTSIAKRNVLNDLLNLFDKATRDSNPDRVSGKGDIDRVIASRRLDRITRIYDQSDKLDALPVHLDMVKRNFLPAGKMGAAESKKITEVMAGLKLQDDRYSWSLGYKGKKLASAVVSYGNSENTRNASLDALVVPEEYRRTGVEEVMAHKVLSTLQKRGFKTVSVPNNFGTLEILETVAGRENVSVVAGRSPVEFEDAIAAINQGESSVSKVKLAGVDLKKPRLKVAALPAILSSRPAFLPAGNETDGTFDGLVNRPATVSGVIRPTLINDRVSFLPGKEQGIKELQDAAEAFAEKMGRPMHARVYEYHPLPPAEVMKALADGHDAAAHAPQDPEVAATYKAATEDLWSQWKEILEPAGFKVLVHDDRDAFGKITEPYAGAADMLAKVRESKTIKFLKTDRTSFGNPDALDLYHPLLNQVFDPVSGKPVTLENARTGKQETIVWNDVLRFVHDTLGHGLSGTEFGPRGEFNAWRAHSALFRPEAQPALAAETLFQNAWVNNGAHLRRSDGSIPKRGEGDYLPPEKRPFSDQKAFFPDLVAAGMLNPAETVSRRAYLPEGREDTEQPIPAPSLPSLPPDPELTPGGRWYALRTTGIDIAPGAPGRGSSPNLYSGLKRVLDIAGKNKQTARQNAAGWLAYLKEKSRLPQAGDPKAGFKSGAYQEAGDRGLIKFLERQVKEDPKKLLTAAELASNVVDKTPFLLIESYRVSGQPTLQPINPKWADPINEESAMRAAAQPEYQEAPALETEAKPRVFTFPYADTVPEAQRTIKTWEDFVEAAKPVEVRCSDDWGWYLSESLAQKVVEYYNDAQADEYVSDMVEEKTIDVRRLTDFGSLLDNRRTSTGLTMDAMEPDFLETYLRDETRLAHAVWTDFLSETAKPEARETFYERVPSWLADKVPEFQEDGETPSYPTKVQVWRALKELASDDIYDQVPKTVWTYGGDEFETWDDAEDAAWNSFDHSGADLAFVRDGFDAWDDFIAGIDEDELLARREDAVEAFFDKLDGVQDRVSYWERLTGHSWTFIKGHLRGLDAKTGDTDKPLSVREILDLPPGEYGDPAWAQYTTESLRKVSTSPYVEISLIIPPEVHEAYANAQEDAPQTSRDILVLGQEDSQHRTGFDFQRRGDIPEVTMEGMGASAHAPNKYALDATFRLVHLRAFSVGADKLFAGADKAAGTVFFVEEFQSDATKNDNKFRSPDNLTVRYGDPEKSVGNEVFIRRPQKEKPRNLELTSDAGNPNSFFIHDKDTGEFLTYSGKWTEHEGQAATYNQNVAEMRLDAAKRRFGSPDAPPENFPRVFPVVVPAGDSFVIQDLETGKFYTSQTGNMWSGVMDAKEFLSRDIAHVFRQGIYDEQIKKKEYLGAAQAMAAEEKRLAPETDTFLTNTDLSEVVKQWDPVTKNFKSYRLFLKALREAGFETVFSIIKENHAREGVREKLASFPSLATAIVTLSGLDPQTGKVDTRNPIDSPMVLNAQPGQTRLFRPAPFVRSAADTYALAIKRALLEAVKRGDKHLAWTTGAAQNKRWSQAGSFLKSVTVKPVEGSRELDLNPNDPGTVILTRADGGPAHQDLVSKVYDALEKPYGSPVEVNELTKFFGDEFTDFIAEKSLRRAEKSYQRDTSLLESHLKEANRILAAAETAWGEASTKGVAGGALNALKKKVDAAFGARNYIRDTILVMAKNQGETGGVGDGLLTFPPKGPDDKQPETGVTITFKGLPSVYDGILKREIENYLGQWFKGAKAEVRHIPTAQSLAEFMVGVEKEVDAAVEYAKSQLPGWEEKRALGQALGHEKYHPFYRAGVVLTEDAYRKAGLDARRQAAEEGSAWVIEIPDSFIHEVRASGGVPAYLPAGNHTDVSTAGAGADRLGATMADVKQAALAKRLWQEQGVKSPFFRNWFRGSVATDEKGAPRRFALRGRNLVDAGTGEGVEKTGYAALRSVYDPANPEDVARWFRDTLGAEKTPSDKWLKSNGFEAVTTDEGFRLLRPSAFGVEPSAEGTTPPGRRGRKPTTRPEIAPEDKAKDGKRARYGHGQVTAQGQVDFRPAWDAREYGQYVHSGLGMRSGTRFRYESGKILWTGESTVTPEVREAVENHLRRKGYPLRRKGSDINYLPAGEDENIADKAERTGWDKHGVLSHGTTHEWTVYRMDKAHVENFLGKAIYLSSDPGDSEQNYSHEEGPDLKSRIERLAEQMESDDDSEEADARSVSGYYREKARKQLVGTENEVKSLYLKLKNPVVLSKGPDATVLDYNDGYNHETDEYDGEPSGLLPSFLENLRNAAEPHGDVSDFTDSILGEVDPDGVTVEWLLQKWRENPEVMDLGDGEGNLVSSEVFREALEYTGFDGVIDKRPAERFRGMRLRKDTVHYMAFGPEQIKSADRTTYDDEGKPIPVSKRLDSTSKDIRYLPEGKTWGEMPVQFENQKPQKGSLKKVYDLVHFASRDMKVLDPKQSFGKGAATPADHRGGPVGYFYTKFTNYEGDISGRSNIYGARIAGAALYDYRNDPLDVRAVTNLEKRYDKLKSLGFKGYFNKTSGFDAVVMFVPTKLFPVETADVYTKKDLKGIAAREKERAGPEMPDYMSYEARDARWEEAGRIAKEKGGSQYQIAKDLEEAAKRAAKKGVDKTKPMGSRGRVNSSKTFFFPSVENPEDIRNLPQAKNWAILTPENPNAKRLPESKNKVLRATFEKAMAKAGLTFTRMRGKYGHKENSYFFPNLTEKEALELGITYQQESVIVPKGLLYQDGSFHRLLPGVAIHDEEPKDLYSVAPGGIFTLEFNFPVRENQPTK